MSVLVGSWGIFRLGELAAAGTAQSSVVSVLRALHEDGFQFTCTHYSPSPRISLQLGSCGGTSAPELPVLPRLVLISGGSQLKPNFGKGQEKGAGRGKGRSFLGCVRGTPGPFGKCCVCR